MGKLHAVDTEVGDWFGDAVAISGDVAAIGAMLEVPIDMRSGSVYLFRHDGTEWSQEAKVTPADAEDGDTFGGSVAISGDLLVAGAPHAGNDGDESGAVYVFRYTGAAWAETAKLVPGDSEAGSFFGSYVDISGDAIIVAAVGDNDNGPMSGSAYVFRFDGQTWNEEAKLLPADGAAEDRFGESVGMSGDTVIVGAQYDDDGFDDAGSAYVFERVNGNWQHVVKLLATDTGIGDNFGRSVDISGSRVLVGSFRDDGVEENAGAAYVFRNDGGGWAFDAKLVASDGITGELFGEFVSLRGDVAMIGAPLGYDGQGVRTGTAYLFRFDPVTTEWAEEVKLTPFDGEPSDEFGAALAIGYRFAMIGAHWDDDLGPQAGALYVSDVVCLLGLCAADLDGSGRVGFEDLLAVLTAWGNSGGPEDVDESGVVDFGDLIELLANWGPCFPFGACCSTHGGCAIKSAELCAAQGGLYRGDATSCQDECPAVGGCCFPDGNCVIEVEDACIGAGGVYQGQGVACGVDMCRPTDHCEDAMLVSDGVYPYSTVDATTGGPNLPGGCDEGNGVLCIKDVWVRYRASCAGTTTASVCDSDFDTRIAVYEGSGCLGPLLACSDDACGIDGARSEVSFPVVSGGTYLVRIGSPRSERGVGTLVLNCDRE